jgi:hypothetical protein
MPTRSSDAKKSQIPGGIAGDLLVGGSMGALLGALLGLSASPIVATITAAVISLLGAALEASGKLSVSDSSRRRVTAFALGALLFGLLALWARTNQIFMPSLEAQRKQLAQIGVPANSSQERELLLYLRYGIRPEGKAVPEQNAFQGVFYSSEAATMCDDLAQADNRDDLLSIVNQAGGASAKLHDSLASLPQPWTDAQVKAVQTAICP